MPIIVLFFALMLGFITFGMILNAIQECSIYWIPALFFGFLTVEQFLKFLAMC